MTQKVRTRATLLTLMGLVALSRPLALALQQLLPDASVNPEMNYVASAMQSLVLFALPGCLLLPAWRRDDAPPMPPVRRWLLMLAAAGLTWMVAMPLNAWWMALMGAPTSPLPPVEGPLGATLLLLAVVVLPAVAEELFFRGALLTNLLQAGSRWQALLLTTLMFALMHGSLAGLPGHLLISLVLTLLMMHSGRLLTPIAAHMLYNLLMLLGWDAGPVLPWLAALLLAGLLVMLLRHLPCGKRRRLPLPEGLLCGAILAGMALGYLL